MEHDELIYRIAFSRIRGLKPTLARQLLALAGDERRFFELSADNLSSLASRRLSVFSDSYRRQLLDEARAEARFIEENAIKPLYITDPAYPQRALECDDAPIMLYTLGNCDLNNPCAISIVGTRHATLYGTRFVDTLLDELAQRLTVKPLIVSGLAHGIDIAAHRAAIRNGFPTVAVLAHGLSTIYPAVHRQVAADIARRHGALVTEYPSSAVVHRGNFLQRNRIIAGMCDCLIVAESALKGGAMVTARIAREYNRDVFALPGRTSDIYSQGCNRLIARNMASLVTDAPDLIDAMRWPQREPEGSQPQLPLELSDSDRTIVDYLRQHGDARVNRMSVDLNIPVARLLAALVDLEFRGLVLSFPGGVYRNA